MSKWVNNHKKKATAHKGSLLRYTYVNGIAEIAAVQNDKASRKAFNILKHAK